MCFLVLLLSPDTVGFVMNQILWRMVILVFLFGRDSDACIFVCMSPTPRSTFLRISSQDD